MDDLPVVASKPGEVVRSLAMGANAFRLAITDNLIHLASGIEYRVLVVAIPADPPN